MPTGEDFSSPVRFPAEHTLAFLDRPFTGKDGENDLPQDAGRARQLRHGAAVILRRAEHRVHFLVRGIVVILGDDLVGEPEE